MGRDQLCFDQVSRVASGCFPSFFFFFSSTQGPVMVDILPQKSTLTATYCVEPVLPGVIKSTRQQHPTVGTSTTLLLHDNTSSHKAKVTVSFLKEQNIQVLAHLPTVSTWLRVTFCCTPSSEKSWRGGIFPAIRTSQKQ